MKHENKNIDKFVQNKLYDYSVPVPDDVWNNITEQLSIPKSKSFFSYWQYVAAAVVILFAFGSGYFISFKKFQKQQAQNHTITFIKDSAHTVNATTLELTTRSSLSSTFKKINIKTNPKEHLPLSKWNKEFKKRENPIKDQSRKLKFADLAFLQNKTENRLRVNGTKIKPLFKTNTGTTKKTYSPKELIALQNEVFEKETKKSINKRWFFGGQIAPTYSYREMKRNHSNLPSNYYNSIEKALLTYSGGVLVNYKVNKRISFQSGFNYSQFGQSSNLLYAQATSSKGSAYEVATSAGIIKPQPKSIGAISNQYQYVDQLGNIINPDATLIQNFDYIEIPFNTKLKLIDKKFDLSIIGGLSTNILLGNKVFFKQANNKSYIGETENLNNIRYSSNFGIGFEYQISKNMEFNMTPTFKYSLIPINKNPEISNYPFTFGLSTGFLINF